MIKNNIIVGHVSRNISVTCSALLRRGGTITCTVTGVRQYSNDLPQGGLEVPCRLNFSASSKEISKIIKLLPLAPSNAGGTATVATNIRPSTVSKPRPVSSSLAVGPLSVKRDPDESYCDLTMEPPPIKRCKTSNSATADAVWLKLEKVTLCVSDKEALCNLLELNDCHINYLQGFIEVAVSFDWRLQNFTLKDKISCGI